MEKTENGEYYFINNETEIERFEQINKNNLNINKESKEQSFTPQYENIFFTVKINISIVTNM